MQSGRKLSFLRLQSFPPGALLDFFFILENAHRGSLTQDYQDTDYEKMMRGSKGMLCFNTELCLLVLCLEGNKNES